MNNIEYLQKLYNFSRHKSYEWSSFYKEKDIRISFIERLKSLFETFGRALELSDYALKNKTKDGDPYFPKDDNKHVRTFVYNLDTYIRVSIVDIFYFILNHLIEDFLKNNKTKPTGRFFEDFNKLLDILKIEDESYLPAVKTFSFMRNSMHNNGFHNKDDFLGSINKKDFIFKKNKIVDCLDWEHLFIIFCFLIDCVENISKTDNLKDKYLEDLAYLPNPF